MSFEMGRGSAMKSAEGASVNEQGKYGIRLLDYAVMRGLCRCGVCPS